jgi:F420-dependent oxidoreductase-like protein
VELGIFVAPQVGATYDDQLQVARLAEVLGFGAFVRSDHYLAAPGQTALPGPTDAWLTLAGLARETKRIRLGTLVSPVTFRWPGPLSIMVAQVDAMSDGRVALGLGASWYEAEHTAYGIPFPPAADRFDQLEEQLAILTGIWATPPGDTFDYEGKWYRLSRCPALPKPRQRPHPPIVVGGRGLRRTPNLAARYAQELNVSPTISPEQAATMFARGQTACELIGRDPKTLRRSVMLTTICGLKEEDVTRRLSYPGTGQPEILGTPSDVIGQLRAYEEAGAQMAYLRLVDLHDLDHLAVLGTEVLPAIQRQTAEG